MYLCVAVSAIVVYVADVVVIIIIVTIIIIIIIIIYHRFTSQTWLRTSRYDILSHCLRKHSGARS